MIFDIETDGLNPTKIHCLAFEEQGVVTATTDYNEMRAALSGALKLVGHNIIRYDLPVLKKLLGWEPRPDQKVVDTLALSWYYNFDRGSGHGLASYGESFGVPKPKIDDWENLTPEEYMHRCKEDVKINSRLYKELMHGMKWLYKDDKMLWHCINYLNFKLQCAYDQEELKWAINVDEAKLHLQDLMSQKQDIEERLIAVMPKVPVYGYRKRPAIWEKKDGSLTAAAEKWIERMRDMCQPISTESVRVVNKWIDANPNSMMQIKAWLHSLGWEPASFSYRRDPNSGDEIQVEKVRGDDGELCPSVKLLEDQVPDIALLEHLGIINHRLSIFKAMVESEQNGYVEARISGFTNTLRFRHAKPLVNLPSVEKAWGKEIRGVLTAPEGYLLCGADMVSLEDTTKRHYMKPHDPTYVDEMSREGFDPHLDLARHAGRVSQEDIDKHNSGERSLKALRKQYKVVNYSATYGVGARKLARTIGITQAEADSMLTAFWDRNWAIEATAKDCRTREKGGKTWLKNPVSGLYHSLRFEKDRFSTLNQSTGVYCFDAWVKQIKLRGLKVIGQFHDEVIVLLKEGEEQNVEEAMNSAIKVVNQMINLNVPLSIDYSFGKTYAEIH